MADSKRLAALKALTNHIETEITVTNGYQHTLTGAVYRGRSTFDDDDPLPCVSVLENLNPDRFPREAGGDDNVRAPVQLDQWILLVQGWVVDDKKNPADPAHLLLADVKKALAKLKRGGHPLTGEGQHANYLLGGLIVGITVEPGIVRPPDQTSAKAYFWMRVILKFVEDINDPYDLS